MYNNSSVQEENKGNETPVSFQLALRLGEGIPHPLAMGCSSSSGSNVDPADKALEYELSDLKIEELMEFMAAVDFGWPEV